MKSSKENSLHKSISLVLIAVLLVFVVGFVANGWQEDLKKPESGENGDKTDNADENKDGPNEDNNGQSNQNQSDKDPTQSDQDNENTLPPIEEIPPAPVYINKITGLEITEEEVSTTPLGFVIDPSLPMYAVSTSDIAIEFPTEDGKTRMLAYTTDNSLLWKIGSLTATRSFISGMSNFFGGIVISYGNDDMVKYSVWDTSKIELNLLKYSNSYYVENTLYVYTSKEMIDVAKNQAHSIQETTYKTAPFDFVTEGKYSGNNEAYSVIIPYSQNAQTGLYYSEKTEKYLYYHNGNRKMDMLTGKNVTFDNVFILFASATTYEKATGSELVIDTMGGGNGYYVTKGTLTEIKWNVDENGNLNFSLLNGTRLSANTGNSFISYYKASRSSSVEIN